MRSSFGPSSTIVALALCCACAAKARERAVCEPVPAEFALVGQSVYRDCEVDRKARPSSAPRLRYTPSGGQRCARAVVDVVVDSTGRPLSGTARVVRTTDASFASAVIANLDLWHYQPAMKDGRPVSQLVRIEQGLNVVTVVVPAGTPPGSVRPPRRPAPC